jgi:hypothetical protein
MAVGALSCFAKESRPVVVLTPAELRQIEVFSRISEPDLEWLAQQTADLHLVLGESLIQEGEPTSFFVLVQVIAEVFKYVMGRRSEVSQHYPGDFFGGLAILMDLWQPPLPHPSAPKQIVDWPG